MGGIGGAITDSFSLFVSDAATEETDCALLRCWCSFISAAVGGIIVRLGLATRAFFACSFSEDVDIVDAARKRIALASVSCAGTTAFDETEVFVDLSEGAARDADSLVVRLRGSMLSFAGA